MSAIRVGAGPGPDRERLELAEALPSATAGLTREQVDSENRRFLAERARIDARLARARTPQDDEIDTYLDLALACAGRPPGGSTLKPEALLASRPPGPLLAWRLGMCNIAYEASLDAALAAEPRFVETSYITGRYRMLAPKGPGTRSPRPSMRDAREALARAHAAFPDSPAITLELAHAVRGISYREALPIYTRVIEQVPGHQDAWFNRGLCESYLKRHEDAVATFTHRLTLGRWDIGSVYYWRAWNRHQLKQLDAAWADVQLAKETLYNSDLYTLAGVVAYDRTELAVARTHLEKGLELEARQCTAAWYLGLVHAAQEQWPDAAGAFSTAATCYRRDADDGRRELALAEALPDDVETKLTQIASARGTIEESQRQEALSAYNAAYGFVRAQAADRARPLLELARQHADVKGRADELLAYVDRR